MFDNGRTGKQVQKPLKGWKLNLNERLPDNTDKIIIRWDPHGAYATMHNARKGLILPTHIGQTKP